jgi:hydrogenase nickel incorporation protein HypA/HybF
MHELSLTENMLEAVLRSAAQAGARRVVHVNLKIGQFSDESEESIRFYWAGLAKGTPAQEAQLNFQHVAAEMTCLECGHAFQPAVETSACPACSSSRLRLSSGDDVKLASIDIE